MIWLLALAAIAALLLYMNHRFNVDHAKWQQSPEGIASRERIAKRHENRKPGEYSSQDGIYDI